MLTVTAMTHQGKGSTVLYIPQDNFANLEAASKDKDIVQRALAKTSNDFQVLSIIMRSIR